MLSLALIQSSQSDRIFACCCPTTPTRCGSLLRETKSASHVLCQVQGQTEMDLRLHLRLIHLLFPHPMCTTPNRDISTFRTSPLVPTLTKHSNTFRTSPLIPTLKPFQYRVQCSKNVGAKSPLPPNFHIYPAGGGYGQF